MRKKTFFLARINNKKINAKKKVFYYESNDKRAIKRIYKRE